MRIVGKMLGVRPQIHKPVVNAQMVFETVVMGISKMHLANEFGEMPLISKVVGHRAVAPVEIVRIIDGARLMGIETCEHRHACSNADRI